MLKFWLLLPTLVLTGSYTVEVSPLPVEFTKPRQAPAQQRRILYFTEAWCKPCREKQKPILDEMKKVGWLITEEPGAACHIRIIEASKHKDCAEAFQIEQVPTFVLTDGDGKELARLTGVQTGAQLLALQKWKPPVPVVHRVQANAYHNQWTWPGRLDVHLRSAHGINPAGMTQDQMEYAHDADHNRRGR